MDTIPQTPFLDSLEKKYRYRSSWGNLVITIIVCGVIGFFLGLLAFSEKSLWLGLLAFFMLLVFLLGIYMAIVAIWGHLELKLTNDGIYIPNTWRWDSYIFIPYSGVTLVQLFKVQANTFLQLSVGKKKYALVLAWFPHKGDFLEIVETVCNRLPDLVRIDPHLLPKGSK